MKSLLFGVLLPFSIALHAATVSITVDAPTYPDRHVLLYRYMDAFTLRTERIAEGRTDASGHVVLTADVQGTERVLLRIGEVGADLFLRAGHYHVKMPAPGPNEVRTISGTARVDPVFIDLDPLDVNALVSDLNERLDAFLAEDLATDQNAGMEAVAKARNDSQEISDETKKKVIEAAKRFKYTLNPDAISLGNKKSKAIAVVMPEVADNFFCLAINGIESVAEKKN